MSLIRAGIWGAVLVFSLLLPARSGSQPSQTQQITPSSLDEDVSRFIERKPNATAKEVTAYANALLKQKGFNYTVGACEFIKQHKLSPVRATNENQIAEYYRLPLRLLDGTVQVFEGEVSGDPCDYCVLLLPALKLSKQEIWLVTDGKQFHLTRPRGLLQDAAELIDNRSRKTLRQWELPNINAGRDPVAISADGQTLYLPAYFSEKDKEEWSQWLTKKKQPAQARYPLLLLAVSPFGIQFEEAVAVLANQRFEDLKPSSKDLQDAYFGYRRFHVAGKTYTVRFSWACT